MVKRRKRRTKKNVGLLKFFQQTFFPKKRRRTKKQKRLETQWRLEVSETIAREIWAVITASIGILISLSLTNKLGIPGDLLNSILKPLFGWGLYTLPPLLFLTSTLLFLSKEIKITMAKLTGAGFFLISLLSIFHLSIPENSLYEFATQGSHGGYIGFITNYFFRSVLKIGNLGSSMIFVPTFLISLLLTFEISITEMIAKLFIEEKAPTKSAIKPETIKIPELDKTPTEEIINIIKPDIEAKPSQPKTVQKVEIIDQEELFTEKTDSTSDKTKSETENTTLEADFKDWEYPSLDLLNNESSKVLTNDKLLKANAEKIRDKLQQFNIAVTMRDIHVGPTVVQYTLKPSEGVKLSKITNLKNDLTLALAATSLRIEAPIPGKGLVGIELPSEQRMTVRLREILESDEFKKHTKEHKLTLPLGRDVSGKPINTDLSDMPHLLIAGATGAGKSVAINTFLISLLYQNSPADLKFIMVDPKQVELKDYNGIPHLLSPVITDPDKAANALKWAVSEMNRRYQTLAHHGCRSIDEFNSSDSIEQSMPKIIILIDELADLMMANGKEVEASICRLAQMARAVGIHLIIATQRPSVDVITGLIKANIPTRISFAVTSSIDSRTILDTVGAEDLLGKGDMLYLQKDFAKPMRIQGIFTAALEIKKVTNKLKLSHEPDYKDEITEKSNNRGGSNSNDTEDYDDELYEDAFQVVVEQRRASASLLQRKLRIGYARAARLLDILEEKGVVGPVNGAKPRDIYID